MHCVMKLITSTGLAHSRNWSDFLELPSEGRKANQKPYPKAVHVLDVGITLLTQGLFVDSTLQKLNY